MDAHDFTDHTTHDTPVAGCVACNGRPRPMDLSAPLGTRRHRPTSDGLPRDDERSHFPGE